MREIKFKVTPCNECISDYVCRFKEDKIIGEQHIIKAAKELQTGILKLSAECEHFNRSTMSMAINNAMTGKIAATTINPSMLTTRLPKETINATADITINI